MAKLKFTFLEWDDKKVADSQLDLLYLLQINCHHLPINKKDTLFIEFTLPVHMY